MTRFGRSRVFGVALAALVTAGACGGKDNKSSDTPCWSGALLHVSLSPNVATMTQPTLSLCRNADCVAWAPSALPTSGSGGTMEDVAVPTASDFSISAILWRNSDATVTLDVEWHFKDPNLLHDGDRYVITLANGAGAATTVFDQTAAYTQTTSNGLDSGAACSEAKLSG